MIQNQKELLNELKTKNFNKKIEAIKKISKSGNDESEKILKALLSSKIYYRKSDKKIFIVENSSNNTLGGDTGIDADFGMEEELIETKLFKKYG